MSTTATPWNNKSHRVTDNAGEKTVTMSLEDFGRAAALVNMFEGIENPTQWMAGQKDFAEQVKKDYEVFEKKLKISTDQTAKIQGQYNSAMKLVTESQQQVKDITALLDEEKKKNAEKNADKKGKK